MPLCNLAVVSALTNRTFIPFGPVAMIPVFGKDSPPFINKREATALGKRSDLLCKQVDFGGCIKRFDGTTEILPLHGVVGVVARDAAVETVEAIVGKLGKVEVVIDDDTTNDDDADDEGIVEFEVRIAQAAVGLDNCNISSKVGILTLAFEMILMKIDLLVS